jgi:hypothetical protein
MFNKKFLQVLIYAVGVLLIAKALFVAAMFVWKYFDVQPVAIFDPRFSELSHYVILVQEIGTILFFLAFVGLMKWWLNCCACECECAPVEKKSEPAAIAPIKKTTTIKRPVAKKKK